MGPYTSCTMPQACHWHSMTCQRLLIPYKRQTTRDSKLHSRIYRCIHWTQNHFRPNLQLLGHHHPPPTCCLLHQAGNHQKFMAEAAPSETSDLHAETQMQVLCRVHVQTSWSKTKKDRKEKVQYTFLQNKNAVYADKLTVKLLACKHDSKTPGVPVPI